MSTTPDDAHRPTRAAWTPSAVTGSLLLLLVLVPLYAATAVTGADVNVDAEAAALPAWMVVTNGTQDLSNADVRGRPALAAALDRNPWIARSDDGGSFSNRPPGLWLTAVPAYLLLAGDDFSPDPATATALLLTIAAVLVVHLVLRRCLPPWWALGGAAVLAVGTATWPMSAAQLWPQGPGQLLFALALLAAASSRDRLSGLAMGAEVLVRPVTVVVPAVIAAGRALERRWGRALWLVVPAALGVVAIVIYNGLTFGRYSLTGGYQSLFRDNLTGQSIPGYVANLVAFLLSPNNGLLVWTPAVLIAFLGVRDAWPTVPSWARRAAVGGALYIAVHARLNPLSAGFPFDYRYALEPVVLASPLLVLSAKSFAESHRRGMQILAASIVMSVMAQGLVAITLECKEGPGSEASCTLG